MFEAPSTAQSKKTGFSDYTVRGVTWQVPQVVESTLRRLPVKDRRFLENSSKWMRDNDQSLNTLSWLDFEMDGDRVSLLRFKICCKYKERLESMRNFRLAYIEGSSSVKTSSLKEHAES